MAIFSGDEYDDAVLNVNLAWDFGKQLSSFCHSWNFKGGEVIAGLLLYLYNINLIRHVLIRELQGELHRGTCFSILVEKTSTNRELRSDTFLCSF